MKIIWNKVTWYSKLLAVVVLAFAIWLGVYFYEEFKKVGEINPIVVQTADAVDTKDWKTYRNEEYGFEFKYPAKFKDQYVESNASLPNCRTNDDIALINELGSLQVSIACESDLIRSNEFKGEGQKIIVSGRNAFLFDYVSSAGYINKEIYITLFDGIYINIMHTYKSGRDEYDELSLVDFNKIISTFKFEDSPSSKISDWKTYRNEEYGFEIKYPTTYSIFQDTDQIREKVIPVTKNSSNVYLTPTEGVKFFFCCEPGYLQVKPLDTYQGDLSVWVANEKATTYAYFQNSGLVNTNDGYTVIGGEKSYKFNETEYGTLEVWIVNHNHVSYKISLVNMRDEYSNGIISSFKFTK